MIKKIIKAYRDRPFAPIGIDNQQTREKWLKKTIKKIPKNKKILDAGAGELQYKKYCDHLKYTSQDFGQYTGDNEDSGLQTGTWDNSKLDIISDITNIPVKEKSFDAVMCIEVFEHIQEPVKAVKEFSRILKNKGKLIITAPFSSITHFAPYYYSSGYSRYWYEKVLNDHGFKILEIKTNGNYFKFMAQETRRLFYMDSEYLKKPFIRNKQKKVIRKMLNILLEMDKRDKNSSELLGYGMHVYAEKK